MRLPGPQRSERASPATGTAERLPVAPTRPRNLALVLVAGALLAAGATIAPPAGAAPTKPLTIYAVATSAQFVNHADDRARGDAINPFNADAKKLVPVSETKEKGKGPFPGDDVLYMFKLYPDASLSHSVGTAMLTCVFNFGQQAECEETLQLNGGTLFASGPADFTSTSVTLAVTGGGGSYLGARGQISTSAVAHPRSKHEERFDIEFG